MTLWEVTPLPRGRHNLAREDVVSAQRTRIFDGLIHAVAERGYAATPVAEILRRAGVSRETFYQQFESKQDCFLQCLDEAVSGFIALLASERPVEVSPRERFRRVLETYLNTLADDPDRARVFLVEVYAAGPEAIVARSGVQELFVDAILTESGSPADRFACESLVAAIAGRVTMMLASDDAEGIRELGTPYLALATKLGIVPEE